MLLFPPRSEAGVWLGGASGRRSWAIGKDKEGPRLGPLRVGSWRSWAIGEDKEGPQLGPFRVGSLASLLFDVLAGTPKS